jgi:hypothetical protein
MIWQKKPQTMPGLKFCWRLWKSVTSCDRGPEAAKAVVHA